MDPLAWFFLILVLVLVIVIACLVAKGKRERREREEQENRRRREAKKKEMRMLKNRVIKMDQDAFKWYSTRIPSNADFVGAFAIHNITKKEWCVESADQVHDAIKKKLFEITHNVIERQIISIRFVPLLDSGYQNQKALYRAMKEAFVDGENEY